jgi:hypothetical protein
VAEDTGFAILKTALLQGDVDPNPKDVLTVAGVSPVANGTLTATADGKGWFFQPARDFNGAASFSYTVSDGRGGTDTGLVTITVTPVNDAPVGQADSMSVGAGMEVVITKASLLANDGDPDGDAISLTSVGPVSYGTLTPTADGTGYVYRAADGYSGQDGFTYVIGDGHGQESDPVTVSLDVLPPAAPEGTETRLWTTFMYYLQDYNLTGPIDGVADVRYPRDPYVYAQTNNSSGYDYEVRAVSEFPAAAVTGAVSKATLHLDIVGVGSSPEASAAPQVDIYVYGGSFTFGTQFWNVGQLAGTAIITSGFGTTVDVQLDPAVVDAALSSSDYLGLVIRPHEPVLTIPEGSSTNVAISPSSTVDVVWA